MVIGKVTVKNPTGLHLRPAGTLCKQAMQFKSSITFHYGDGNTANAKKYYQMYLDSYSEYRYADDAQEQLNALGGGTAADGNTGENGTTGE